jgi:hypothetical protein
MNTTRTLASAVPGRPLDAVYHHARRAFQPWARQGPWEPADDNSLLEWDDFVLGWLIANIISVTVP